MTAAQTGPQPAAADQRRQQQAQALLEAVTDKILRPFKFGELSDLALRRARQSQQSRTVVVVGEVKRGKSSLVNALVGMRDASPVGVDVTTSTTISFGPASDDDPAGTARIVFPDRSEQIAHRDLADWVSCEGRHVSSSRTDELPTRAMVPVPGSRLGDINVVDTPGVGGLNNSYAALATASAAQACVLVIVCDATTPLTAPEMEFIRETGGGIESLIVAVTKTDKNLRRWQPIVGENKALLRAHLGRDVPVVGVSSLLALRAAELPPGPDRDAAERQCGITELRSLIAATLASAQHHPVVSGLRTARGGLAQLADALRSEADAIENSAQKIPDLTAQLDELQQLKDHSQQWEQYLARDLTLTRQRAIDELDRKLDEIRNKWTDRINKNGMAVLRKNPQHFTAEMERDFQEAMATAVNLFLDGLYTQIVKPRFDSEVVWDEISRNIATTLSGQRLETSQVASKRHGLLDPSMLTMGVMGSSMLGGMIGVSAIVGVGAVVGVAWVGFNLGFKAMRSGKTNLLNWLRETIGTTKTTAARILESSIALARPEIVIRYRNHLKNSMDALQTQITEAKDTARQDQATREAKLTRAKKNLEIVEGNITKIDQVIAAMPAAAPAPTPTPAPPPAAPPPPSATPTFDTPGLLGPTSGSAL
ncbi:dynamin family protein [Rhodococcus triatomae]